MREALRFLCSLTCDNVNYLPLEVVGGINYPETVNVNPIDYAEGVAGAGLVSAMLSKGNNAVKRAMQGHLKVREAQAAAELVVQSVLAGRATVIRTLSKSSTGVELAHLEATYMVGGSNGGKQHEIIVQHIPELILVGILHSTLTDPDPNTRDRLHPVAMATLSPRVFWNVVYAGGVGPEIEFRKACEALMPEGDWAEIFERRRTLKYDSLEWAC